MITVEQVLANKKQAEELSARIQLIKARMHDKKALKDSILEKYHAKDMQELMTIRQRAIDEMNEANARYSEYIKNQMPILMKVENESCIMM